MSNKRYRLLVFWNNLHLMDTIHDSYESVKEQARCLSNDPEDLDKYFYLEWEEENRKSLTLGTFYDGSWPALNDAIEAIKEHEEKSEEWTSFKPYEPLPVDEEGNPYFPPDTKGILIANLEMRLPNEKRLQFIEEEGKDDKEGID